jgi:hypothetical protein
LSTIAKLVLVSIVHATWLGPIDVVIDELFPLVDWSRVLLFIAQLVLIPIVQPM